MNPSNICLVLAYEGTCYLGWQKTAHGKSIEEELEKALQILLRHPVTLQAASRTDRGVHAEGQVVNFFTPLAIDPFRLQRGLNALLPSDISVLSIQEVPSTFHPTLDAKGKEYHYYLALGQGTLPFQKNFHWHIPLPLQLDEMKEASLFLLGKRDFGAFANHNKNTPPEHTIREVFSITFHRFSSFSLRIEVKGNNFLYKMVRNMIGALVYVGLGKLKKEDLRLILESKNRKAALMVTAPSHGLILKQVYYE